MALPVSTVFRDFQTDGNPSSGAHEPVKSEIRDLLETFATTVNAVVTSDTIANLRSLSPSDGDKIYLTENYYTGLFIFDDSDQSANIIDTINYIAPSSDLTGASGAWVRSEEQINQKSTGAFWTTWDEAESGLTAPTTLGAKVQRFQDRVFIGDACDTSGDFPATTKDWLEQFEADRSHVLGFRTSWSQLASIATNAGIGVLGAARTSDSDLATLQLSMGGCFIGVNDNTTNQQLSTALYAVAFRLPGAGSISHTGTTGAEIDIANEGAVTDCTPADIWALGFTAGLQVNSGAVSPNATTASYGIAIGNNGANYKAGMIFAQDALDGVTITGGVATGGAASAIRMGAFHQVEWWNNNGSAPSAYISSEMVTPANAQSIVFKDTGIEFGGPSTAGRAFQTIYPGGTTGGWLAATPAHGANSATLSVEGQTNGNLVLRPAGTGSVALGSYVAGAPVATGYVLIADYAGSPLKVLVG